MNRTDELIAEEGRKHLGEIRYSYSIYDLIKKDLITRKDSILSLTIKDISEQYEMPYGTIAKILREIGVKVKRTYRGRDLAKPPKPKKDHTISSWASLFNNGRLRYVYYDMIRRCHKETSNHYKYYGGRGIKVCEEWRKDCCNFYRWAKDNGYDVGLQIDRIDNDGDYCPENCRWITPSKNNYNKSDTRFITYNGEKHTLIEWESITGISKTILADRIYKYHWDIERALTQKPSK